MKKEKGMLYGIKTYSHGTVARLAVLLVATAAIVGGFATRANAAAYISSVTSGNPGGWFVGTPGAAGYAENCAAPGVIDGVTIGGTRNIFINDFGLTRSSSYPNATQDISVTQSLQWSTNGASWTQWQTHTDSNAVPPGYNMRVSGNTFQLYQYGGLFWRVRLVVDWSVGTTSIGHALMYFQRGNIRLVGVAGVTQLLDEGICYVP